jgi:uncharacterized membrane protein YbhN (UPF0104 family)
VLATVVKGAIAVALLAWLFGSGQLDLGYALRVDAVYVAGLAAMFLGFVIQTVRWWLLLRVVGVPMSLGRSFATSWVSQFFAQVLPGASTGEIVRILYVVRDSPDAKLAATSSVLVDRAMGLYAYLWLGVLSLGATFSLPEAGYRDVAAPLLVSFAGVSAITLLVIWAPAWRAFGALLPERIRAPLDGVASRYQANGRMLALCFAISLASAALVLGSFYCAALIVDPRASWQSVMLVAPLVLVASVLPITPGGIGVAEGAAALLFARVGVESGASIMLLVRVWLVLTRLPGAFVYIVLSRRIRERGTV